MKVDISLFAYPLFEDEGGGILIPSYYQVPAEKANDLKTRLVFTDDDSKPKE